MSSPHNPGESQGCSIYAVRRPLRLIYIPNTLFVTGNATATANNIAAHELLFRLGITALLITDKAAAEVRPTYDVDAIAEITSYVGYTEFSKRLKALGFREHTREGAPLCRWCQQTTTLDVMPLDAKNFGLQKQMVWTRDGNGRGT